MKYIDLKNLDQLPGRRIETGDTFNFHCYPGVSCFNKCCRNLNLFLYPYDIIRLKKNLKISSDIFIDRYMDVVLRPSSFFPEVLLRMADNDEKTCPFLSEDGCSVYIDRPDTCRTFPVEQGVFYDVEHDETKLLHFFRPPDFCMGQYEKKEWTTHTWSTDQDAVLYNKMTIRWSEVKRLFQVDPFNGTGLENPKAKMAFMATYNVDLFRNFIFKSTFLRRYKIKKKVLRKIKKDDAQLMLFGFDWVQYYIWGIKSSYFS